MSKKILVIEDEESLGKSIKTYLEHHNYQVTCISDGVTGLEVIRDEQPDLILTDLLLPRLHGFDICKTVKQDKHLKSIPLIVMTAVYKNSVHKLEAKRIGVDDFLEKPLKFDELLAKIEQHLGPSALTPRIVSSPARVISEADQKKQRDETIQEQFQELKKDYASRLPKRLMELEGIWESIRTKQDTAKQLARFRRLAHNLTGSGTTFGFKELSEYAMHLEILLDMIIAEGEATIDDKKDQIESLLDKMRHDPLVSTEMEIMRQMGNIDDH